MMYEIRYRYKSKAEFRRVVRKASWKNKWLRAIVGICTTVAVIPVILFWITGGNQHPRGAFGGCVGGVIAIVFAIELSIHRRLQQSPGLLNETQITFDEEGLREIVPNEVEIFLPWSKVKNAFLDGRKRLATS